MLPSRFVPRPFSQVCLGTMTFGKQNTEEEAHAIMDHARDAGVNFLDAAEVYPVPLSSETVGRTEEIVGSWLKKQSNRSSVIVATKVSHALCGAAQCSKA